MHEISIAKPEFQNSPKQTAGRFVASRIEERERPQSSWPPSAKCCDAGGGLAEPPVRLPLRAANGPVHGVPPLSPARPASCMWRGGPARGAKRFPQPRALTAKASRAEFGIFAARFAGPGARVTRPPHTEARQSRGSAIKVRRPCEGQPPPVAHRNVVVVGLGPRIYVIPRGWIAVLPPNPTTGLTGRLCLERNRGTTTAPLVGPAPRETRGCYFPPPPAPAPLAGLVVL